jgi:hypothetical protein
MTSSMVDRRSSPSPSAFGIGAPIALGVAALLWLLAGYLPVALIRPHWSAADGMWWSGIDPIPGAEARTRCIEAGLILLGCAIAASLHLVAAWNYSVRQFARRATILFGTGYMVLAVACVSEWLADRSAPALLFYAMVSVVLAVPMLNTIRLERRIGWE